MTLGYYFLSNPIVINEDYTNVLVIENKKEFRMLIEKIINGVEGEDIDLYLMESPTKPLSFSKNVDIITDIYSIDFQNKKIITKINEELSQLCRDYEEDIYEIIHRINELAGNLTINSRHNVIFDDEIGIPKIVKFLDFNIDSEEMSLQEKILEHMNICRNYFGKKLFVIVNLHTYFDKEEMDVFYKNISYEKYNVLMIESSLTYKCQNEKILIIDNDLCEIY